MEDIRVPGCVSPSPPLFIGGKVKCLGLCASPLPRKCPAGYTVVLKWVRVGVDPLKFIENDTLKTSYFAPLGVGLLKCSLESV